LIRKVKNADQNGVWNLPIYSYYSVDLLVDTVDRLTL